VISTLHSFHGRTLGGIAATGQEKVKAGFGPMPDGFRCDVPFNDLEAMRAAVGPRTAALLIEGIQGEGGITAASVEYLLGLRRLCDEKNILLMVDAVQCGHFRSGCFQSYQRVLSDALGAEEAGRFVPDAVSMAKSLGGGFPMGAFWVAPRWADLLGPGSHGTTYGGTPLGCAVALKVLEIIQRDHLPDHARETGQWLHAQIAALADAYPHVVQGARGDATSFVAMCGPVARSGPPDHTERHPDCPAASSAESPAGPGGGRHGNHPESRALAGLNFDRLYDRGLPFFD
jgi:acetylornithine aminotransferase/acetylornithine/N-succinyldiaminopimelate aminotransferase